MKNISILLAACFLLAGNSNACWTINPIRRLSLEEVLEQVDVVIYGKELRRKDSVNQRYDEDAEMQVYCVLKNTYSDRRIPEFITVENVWPLNSCQGTRVRTLHIYI